MTNKSLKIIRRLIKENDEIQELEIHDTVRIFGNGGCIILPKELVGKRVIVYYKSVTGQRASRSNPKAR